MLLETQLQTYFFVFMVCDIPQHKPCLNSSAEMQCRQLPISPITVLSPVIHLNFCNIFSAYVQKMLLIRFQSTFWCCHWIQWPQFRIEDLLFQWLTIICLCFWQFFCVHVQKWQQALSYAQKLIELMLLLLYNTCTFTATMKIRRHS